jgi:hypothetical protein
MPMNKPHLEFHPVAKTASISSPRWELVIGYPRADRSEWRLGPLDPAGLPERSFNLFRFAFGKFPKLAGETHHLIGWYCSEPASSLSARSRSAPGPLRDFTAIGRRSGSPALAARARSAARGRQ